MLTDTHAHLDSLEDPEGAVERARSNGVERIISISSGLESSKKTLAFA
ncbi:MAG: TatD family hydrolase, partial [Candidatus Dadabacteria bacterium]|nr:TatD family hydrolase [Candidatus Dadabacteria bacterium]